MTLGLRDPEIYLELLKTFPPRPITSEAQLLATQQVIDALLDQAELTPDEQDYLNVLGALVYEYEQQYQPMPELYGVELIQALLAEANLNPQVLLPIFKTEAVLSAVLSGQQDLTGPQIQELADFFDLAPDVFLAESKSGSNLQMS
jgi:HTH-type transcriptional regulator/antitoxin HigA